MHLIYIFLANHLSILIFLIPLPSTVILDHPLAFIPFPFLILSPTHATPLPSSTHVTSPVPRSFAMAPSTAAVDSTMPPTTDLNVEKTKEQQMKGGRAWPRGGEEQQMICGTMREEKAGLCLYGLPDGTWKVNFPVEKIPSILPEPVCGINFAHDGTAEKDWISLIAVHSDAWLLSMAFYHAGRLAFDREASLDRTELFRMINSFSTTFEVVRESYEKRSQVCNGSIENKSSFQPPRQANSNSKKVKQTLPMLEEDNGAKAGGGGDDQASNECAACCEAYSDNDWHFWIFCDNCCRWFHGKCVQVTPAMAEEMGNYVCPGCSYRSKATTKASWG